MYITSLMIINAVAKTAMPAQIPCCLISAQLKNEKIITGKTNPISLKQQ
jgi:hypothetical protein